MSKRTPKGFEPSREDACIPEQLPISVYWNPYKDVVIRQHAADPDDDVWVRVRPENVQALVKALQDAVA